MTHILNSENENYIDLSTAKAFVENSKGSLTVIYTKGSGCRLRLSNELLDSIGNPEEVEVLFTDKAVCILPKREGKSGYKVTSQRIIYSSDMCNRVMEISGSEFEKGKSTNIGHHHLQKLDDDTITAVVTF